MKSKLLTVYIVDDDTSFRQSLAELVTLMGYTVVAFDSAEAFLDSYVEQRTACLLLDMFLAKMDGFALQQKMKSLNLFIPIVFITGHGDVPMGVEAMKRGAFDFILKPVDSSLLRRVIEDAFSHYDLLSQEASVRKEVQSRIRKLTSREQDIMREIITGKLNKQIAATLGIAEKTVRTHRSRVMKKLGVRSVADLVRLLDTVGITISSTPF